MRLLNCPGSHAAEAATPREPETPDAVRDGGTLIHAAICGDERALAQLTPDQIETKEKCERLEFEAASKYIDIEDGSHSLTREERLWLHNDELEKIFSGQPDVIRISHERHVAVITDFKSGWAGAEPAEQNAQIMALAVLVANAFDVAMIYGIIVQPNAMQGPKVSVVEYGPGEIVTAERMLRAAIAKANQPDAPRASGEWCKFCRAKLNCMEFQSRALAVELYGQTSELSHEKLLTMFDHWTVVKGMGAQLESVLKRIIKENPEAFAGKLRITEGRNMPTVDPMKAWGALSEMMAPDEFIGCCKVSLTGLRETYHKNTGGTLKEAKEKLGRILGDAVTYKKSEGSLERI